MECNFWLDDQATAVNSRTSYVHVESSSSDQITPGIDRFSIKLLLHFSRLIIIGLRSYAKIGESLNEILELTNMLHTGDKWTLPSMTMVWR